MKKTDFYWNEDTDAILIAKILSGMKIPLSGLNVINEYL